eukprot:8930886-Pyramimonas_sp.AAC.1
MLSRWRPCSISSSLRLEFPADEQEARAAQCVAGPLASSRACAARGEDAESQPHRNGSAPWMSEASSTRAPRKVADCARRTAARAWGPFGEEKAPLIFPWDLVKASEKVSRDIVRGL